MNRRHCFTLLCFVALTCGIYRPAKAQLSESAKAEIRALPWQPAGNIHLQVSRSRVFGLSDYTCVTGTDAERFRYLVSGLASPGIEADVYQRTTGNEAIFSFQNTGFVDSSDWSSLDSASLLSQISQNTESDNEARRAKHTASIHVNGWVQAPVLSAGNHTVSWIIRVSVEGSNDILNAVALKLGRSGYERITYIEDIGSQLSAPQDLAFMASSHEFDAGSRYEDYVSGSDRSAEFGVAGLVAGALGVKLLKVAAVGGILLGFKKLAFLTILPFIYLFRVIFRKKPGPA